MVRGRVAYLIKLYDKYLECLARCVLKNLKAMDQEKSIEFHHVSFRLPDGRTLLSDLDLEIHRGETLVLLGRSGSGKTTTMKLINRLLDPTEGEVMVEGKSTLNWDPIRLRRRVGYVIQEIGLFPH